MEYRDSKYLKLRSFEYIKDKLQNFVVCKIHGILVGSAEIKALDENTYELGGFVIKPDISSVLKKWVGVNIVLFIKNYSQQNNKDLISLTNNVGLQRIYTLVGGCVIHDGYSKRREESPSVLLFTL